jgi:hypothetical protein
MTGKRIYPAIRAGVIFLPVSFFLWAVALPFIPGAIRMFSDSDGPWYQPVTARLFLAALIYSNPVTVFCTHLISDETFLSPGYYFALAIYTALWALVLRTIFRLFERRRTRSA